MAGLHIAPNEVAGVLSLKNVDTHSVRDAALWLGLELRDGLAGCVECIARGAYSQHRVEQPRYVHRQSAPPWCVLVFGFVDFEGVLEVVAQHGFHVAGEGAVHVERGDFEVEAERAAVQVHAADGGGVVVHQQHFLVHEAGLVAEHADAGAQCVVGVQGG